MKLWVPLTFEAFEDYRLGRVELSRQAAELVTRWIAGEDVGYERSGLSKREWDDLLERFGRTRTEPSTNI
jgi:thymidylate synthase (FAD)